MFLYNPFERVAGWKAFGIGIAVVIATILIGYRNNVIFLGLQIKMVPGNLSLGSAFLTQFIGLASTTLTFYIIAVLAVKNVRFQDILGTVTLARYPLFFAAIVGLFLDPAAGEAIIMDLAGGSLDLSRYTGFLLLSTGLMLFSIWSAILLYYAFKVTTDLKGGKRNLLFVLAIFISEVLSMVVATVIL